MLRLATRLVPLALVALAPASLAGVIDVRGPAPDFAQIGDAVNAAQDGDIVRVWPGTYSSFAIVDKSLVVVRAQPGVVLVDGTIEVRSLAQQRSVVLSGVSATAAVTYGLVVRDCRGAVRVHDGTFRGSLTGPSQSGNRAGIWAVSCADLALSDCSVVGGFDPDGLGGGLGRPAFVSADSRVSAYASTFHGGWGQTEPAAGASGGSGGDGIVAFGNGRLYLSDCFAQGGGGADADPGPDFFEYGWGGRGGDGVSLGVGFDASFLGCTLLGGAGGWGPQGHLGAPGSAVFGSGTVLPGQPCRLETTPWTDDASPIHVTVQGAPRNRVFLHEGPAPDYLFDALHGPSLVADPTPPQAGRWRLLGNLDAFGLLAVDLAAPPLPAFGTRVIHYQALTVGATSYLSDPSATAVLDTAW